MNPRLLRQINIYLGIVAILFLVAIINYVVTAKNVSTEYDDALEKAYLTAKPKDTTPPFNYNLAPEAYDAIGNSLLQLKQNTLKNKVPDLRNILVSYGVLLRPDQPEEKTMLSIGIRGQYPPINVRVGENVYLKYDPKAHFRWAFSEHNIHTSIWLETEVQNSQIIVLVRMEDAQGKIVPDNSDTSYFVLSELPYPQLNEAIKDWTIGDHKVDAALLTHQNAKWYGQDLFLQNYGGEEYAYAQDRQRIEFDDGMNYACFVKEGDLLAFSDNRWNNVMVGPQSIDKPLLYTKKVTDNVITFDLWSPNGKHKIPLEIHKTSEPHTNNKALNIKLVGAKSRKDWIVDVGGNRMILRSDDWLIYQDDKCERMTSQEQIDDYLSGKLRSELVILEGTKRVENELCLTGTKISKNKTELSPVLIPLYKQNAQDKNLAAKAQENLSNQNEFQQNSNLYKNGDPKDMSGDEDYDEYTEDDEDEDYA